MPADQFWRYADGELTSLDPTTFLDEDELQALVERHPELLSRAIDTDPESPGWLLITREAGIAYRDDDTVDQIRWSLDHLFVDADGTPTLVEVKRASDPRARREVVAQVLDYAASFRSTWSADRMAQAWRDAVAIDGSEPDQVIGAYLSPTRFDTPEEYWSEVGSRIAANRLRLLFVADTLPGPLVQIIEYLNEQMTQTEVLGIEISPRIAAGTASERTLSVSLRGATAAASRKKSTAQPQTRDDFDRILRANHAADAADAVDDLVSTFVTAGAEISIGTRTGNPALFPNFAIRSGMIFPVSIRPRDGRVVLQLRWLANRPGFGEEHEIRGFLQQMEAATNLDIASTGQLNGFPSFPVGALVDTAVRSAVAEAVLAAVARSREQAP